MTIETYISDLLYRHDCVIVPGLGGFITNYLSAQIHPISHALRPPSKSVSFNIQLQNNDGLLSNYIASCESCSYQEAQAKIEHFVRAINNDLEHKKEASIAKVGILSRDINGKITFEPENSLNYLLDSFGLESLQSPAILRKSDMPSLPKQVAKGAKQIQAQKANINWKVAAVILPLIGLSTYVSFQQEGVRDAYANYAYLNPFKDKPAAVYTPRHIELEETTIKLDIAKEEIPAEKTVELIPTIKDTDPPLTVDKEDDKKETKKAAIKSKMIRINYHLIAGCFSSEANAQKLVSQLTTQGFKSSIIGQNENGLYRVAFASYPVRQQALSNMQSLKESGKSTWLLKQ